MCSLRVYVCVLSGFSHVPHFATLWVLCPWGFSIQEYWNGLTFPSPEDLSNPGIKLPSFISSALTGEFFTTSTTWEALKSLYLGTNIIQNVR